MPSKTSSLPACPSALTAYARAACAVALFSISQGCSSRADSNAAPLATDHVKPPDSVALTPSQVGAIKIAPLKDHTFAYRKQAVGIVDYDQNRNVQVFSPYQGRIIDAFADLGDRVGENQPLFSIESPDFIAAESSLISAAATLDQTRSALRRARELYATRGIDQNDYEAAVANEQAADGALSAARREVAIFGRNEAQIDAIIASRKVDRALIVKSPIAGVVTARNAAPGQLEQPGSPPAPFSVADIRRKWLVATVSEQDSPLLRPGQNIEAHIEAYPDRIFTGTITRVANSLDPNTHRLLVRSEVHDSNDQLIPGMVARFAITVQQPITQLAIPVNGVVRNGDGTLAAWVTADRHQFVQRLVTVGEPLDGVYPVLAGLDRGELVVIDGAVFISNILFAPPSD